MAKTAVADNFPEEIEGVVIGGQYSVLRLSVGPFGFSPISDIEKRVALRQGLWA